MAVSPSKLCFAIITIDQFATIHERYGPGVVERVVRIAGETLQDHCGAHPIGRWAPDSLAVIFIDIAIPAAATLLAKARASLAARNMKTRETDQPLGKVTFSAGLAPASSADPQEVVDKALTFADLAFRAGGDAIRHEHSGP